MPDSGIVFIVIFFSVFVHSALGFGVALISMPVLAATIGLSATTPLIALIAMTIRIFILARYRESFEFGEIWRLVVTALVFIPVGFLFSTQLEDRWVEVILGAVVTGYALYTMANPDLPPFERSAWAYGLGSASGFLAGAYNIGGPPAIVFATGRQWPPQMFKGNLQALALFTGSLVILTRALDGEFTATVMHYYWLALPATGLGLVAGFRLGEHMTPPVFRKSVQVLLLLIGLNLML